MKVGGISTWDSYGVWLGEKVEWVNRAGNFPLTPGQAQSYTRIE